MGRAQIVLDNLGDLTSVVDQNVKGKEDKD